MAPQAQTQEKIKPVFFLVKDLPADDKPISTREICSAIEAKTGYGTMEGAQRIGGLWRLYPTSRAARLQLLVSGVTLRNVHLHLHDENPFLVGHENREQETTKVFIANVPLSFSNNEIEKALTNLGCRPVSRLRDECDRDEAGRLTRWKTGRRFIYIAVPKEPLPTEIKIGMFTAKIYHREQKTAKNVICGNCLERGHRRGDCKAEIVCRQCKRPGHKAGDMLCTPMEGPPTAWSRDRDPRDQNKLSREGTPKPEMEEEDSTDSCDYSSSNESENIKEKEKKRKRKTTGAEGSDTSSALTPERESKLARDNNTSDEDSDTVTS